MIRGDQLSQLTIKTLRLLIPERVSHNVPEPPEADPENSACPDFLNQHSDHF